MVCGVWVMTVRYIPAAIQPALMAGTDKYLAELREVSVLFVKCAGLNIVASSSNDCFSVCIATSHASRHVCRRSMPGSS